jgi:hypothetical protein
MQIRNLTRKILAVFIAFLIAGCFASKPESPDAWKTKDNTTMAYVMMEEFVKDKLKSPSSAEFAGMTDPGFKIKKNGFEYTIGSWVDSQNSFGAMMRTRFAGKVRQIDKDNWELLALEFQK